MSRSDILFALPSITCLSHVDFDREGCCGLGEVQEVQVLGEWYGAAPACLGITCSSGKISRKSIYLPTMPLQIFIGKGGCVFTVLVSFLGLCIFFLSLIFCC